MEVNGNGTQETKDAGLDFTWDENDTSEETQIIETVNNADIEDEEIIEGAEPTTKKKKKEAAIPNEDSIFNDFTDDDAVVVADEDEEEESEDEPVTKPKKKKEVKPASEDDDEDDDPAAPEEKDKEFFTTLSKELKEKGVFSNVEIKDDDVIDEEKFFELQEAEVDSRVDETFKGFFEDLKEDADAIGLIKFVKAGGSSKEYLKKLVTSPVLEFGEDYNLEKKGNATKLVKHYLMTEDGETEEEATETIEMLEEKGKLEARAETLHQKMLKKDAKEKAAILKQAQDAQVDREEKATKYRQGLTKTLTDLEEVNNIKFTAEDKKTLVDKLTKPSVKVGDNKYITSFQAKMNEIMKDPAKLFLLAKLVDKDLDTKDIIKDITTQQVSKVKSTLAKIGKTQTKTLGNSAQKNKNLADFFTE